VPASNVRSRTTAGSDARPPDRGFFHSFSLPAGLFVDVFEGGHGGPSPHQVFV
jgi:hypothetical protein